MNKSTSSTSENGSVSERENSLIVGIGASAGGIQALKKFFENVPADSGMAYVVILHLSPDHESRLAEVLQTTAQIPVTQVKGRVKVEPNHVYVVPPNQHLGMSDGHIVVEPNVSVEERRAPVDIFFRTLAESHHERAISVVLSGTGADGSMGLKRVKERGGVAFVQNPREAEFSEMPRNSIATELVDAVLNVGEIPAKILAYRNNLGAVSIPDVPESRPEDDQAALREIFAILRVRTGHDFSNYKHPTVLRRIERRINVRELQTLSGYAVYLRENLDEATALLKDLLISVTNFFRDKEAFRFLETDVVPRILQGKTAQDEIRVWVAGCATGEEAYSLAMLLVEQTEDSPVTPAIQIFATDIDEAAIATAREGFYTLNDAADVSPERLQRFFTKEGDGFRVRRELREMILFANHNLLKDAPFSHLDLLTCRNLLIYFNSTAQERAMETFHFALNPGSFLFLGTSESVDGAGNLYANVSKEHHVYQSRQAAARIAYPVPEAPPVMRYVEPKTPTSSVTAGTSQEQENRLLERISFGDLHQRLLEQYAPPSIVVNENYDIVHLSERAGHFLHIAGGEPSNNLLQLVRPELRLELRTALFQAAQRRENVVAANLKTETDGGAETINIQVRPVLRAEDTARGFLLVIFEPSSGGAAKTEAQQVAAASDESLALRLEVELERTKAQLRTTAEQFEIQTEELRASNEELQAMNEELRSTAEELETSREELQSVNEELLTVNQELKIKIEEMTLANSYLQNLMNATDLATIFLDRKFCVRMFTPAARSLFNLIQNDIGRPLSDITNRLEDADLIQDAEAVLETLQTVEREARTTDDRVYTMRVLPYRTTENHINGVVVTFFDITDRRRAEETVELDLKDTQTLHELSTRLVSEENVQTIYDEIMTVAIRLTRADAGTVQIYDEATRELVLLAHRNFEPKMTKRFERVGAGSKTPCRIAMEKNERTFVDFEEAGADDSCRLHVEAGYLSAQSTPLIARSGEPIGMLNTHWRAAKHRPTERELRFLDLLARQAADLIEQRQAEERLRRAAEMDAFRVELADALRPLTDPPEIQQAAMRVVGEHLAVDRVLYAEIADDSETITIADNYVRGDLPKIVGQFYASDFGTAKEILRAGQTFITPDAERDERLPVAEREALRAQGNIAIIAVPLVKNGRWVSNLGAYHGEPHEWSVDEIRLLEETAERTWAAIERARAEEAMGESHERRQFVLESAKIGDWEMDLMTGQARHSFIHDQCFGATEPFGEWSYDIFLTYIHPDDRPEVERKFGEAIKERKEWDFECRVIWADRSVHWIQAKGYFYRDGGENPSRMLGIVSDITERKQAEEALRESEERFRAMFEQANVGIVQITVDGQLLMPNQGFCKVIGYSADETARLNLRDVTHPDDFKRETELNRKLLAGEIPSYTMEKRYICKNGETVWGQMTATVVRSPTHDPQYIVAIVEDITERKMAQESLRESEERLRLLVESASDYAIFTTTLDNCIESWNAGAEKVFGWTEAEALGQPGAIIFTPEDRAAGEPEKEIETAIKEGRAPDERWHVRKGGSRFFASGVMTPLKNSDGDVQGFVKIARDMTERLAAEKTLRAKENLQQLVGAQEDERKRIARDMHDHLGQKLTALRLQIAALKEACGKSKKLCARVEEAQRLAAQLDLDVDFLAWELRPAALDDLGLEVALADYVREWSGHFNIPAEFHTTNLEPTRLAPEIEINLYRITQEALNNINKHANATRADVLLERRANHVVLIVEDDGEGFDLNKKSNSDPTVKGNGDRGLGLVGMRERAALVGGTLQVESEPGAGATIFARIPISYVTEGDGQT